MSAAPQRFEAKWLFEFLDLWDPYLYRRLGWMELGKVLH